MNDEEENPAAPFTDDELVTALMSTAASRYLATLKNDVDEHNLMMELSYDIVAELRKRGDTALSKLLPVLDHEEDCIRLQAAWALLPRNPSAARPVLEKIASNGLWFLALEAQMLLEGWGQP